MRPLGLSWATSGGKPSDAALAAGRSRSEHCTRSLGNASPQGRYDAMRCDAAAAMGPTLSLSSAYAHSKLILLQLLSNVSCREKIQRARQPTVAVPRREAVHVEATDYDCRRMALGMRGKLFRNV